MNHSEVHNYGQLEAIDLARGQLDFGAMANATPSVKAVLLRAQTMGPLAAKPSPLKFTAAAAVAVGVLGAVCLPWVPLQSNLAVVQAGFERTLTLDEAQKLVSRLTRDRSDGVVVGAQFTPEGDGGRLRLSFTGAGVSAERIQREASAMIASMEGGLEPLFTVEAEVMSKSTSSPLLLALGKLRQGDSTVEVSEPLAQAQFAADSLLRSERLLQAALQQRYAATRRGIELDSLRFLPAGRTAGDAGLDFVVEAWPLNLGVDIRDFNSYTSADQQFILEQAYAFAAACGLDNSGALSAGVPGPLSLTVLRKDGSPDAYVTRLLLAYLVQPSEAELGSANYDPKAAVEQACERLMPGQPVLISFADPGRGGRAGVRHYEATVQLCSSSDIRQERRIGGLGSRSVDEAESTEEAERDW